MMFLAVLALAAAPKALVVVTTVGVGDADEAAFKDRVATEMRAAGVETVTLPPALAMKPDCLDEPACTQDVMRAAETDWLVRVELLRGGGNVQIAGALLDRAGKVAADGRAITRLDELLAGKAIVPGAVIEALRGLAVPPPEPPPSEPAPSEPSVPSEPTPPIEPLAPSEPPTTTPAEVGLSTLALAGIGGVVVGGAAAIVGVLGAVGQYGVARDPSAIGPDKEQASVLVPVFGALAVVGAAVGAGGAWLLATSE